MTIFINVSGLGWSGSSAVTDWLADIEGVDGGIFVVPKEFKLLARGEIYSVLSAKKSKNKIIFAIKGILRLLGNRIRWRNTDSSPRSISNKTERLHYLDIKTTFYLAFYIVLIPVADRRFEVWYWQKYLNYIVKHFTDCECVVLDQPSVLSRDNSSLAVFGDYFSIVVHRNVKDQCYDELKRKNKLSEINSANCISRKLKKLKQIESRKHLDKHFFISFEEFVQDQSGLMRILKDNFPDRFIDSYNVSKRFVSSQSKLNIGIGKDLDCYLSGTILEMLDEAEGIRRKLGQA